MAQVFPRSLNKLPLFAAIAGVAVPTLATGAIWYWGSPKYTDVGYAPVQPVAYSHKLHAGDLGIDCRYCHASVETSSVANVPPTQTCMNCHTLVKRDSALLAPIRDSAATGKPMKWVRVHEMPDYAYFNHAVHVNANVGCTSCHGRVDQMEIVRQVEPLSMGWCLECHRDPTPHVRPASVPVTQMDWQPTAESKAAAQKLLEWAGDQPPKLNPPTHCGACHR